jgi:glycosyltransferase involved in cell wall biosynthesis
LTAVSVIIPAHNAAATIAATLASLRSEAGVIGEVLLVDDSSVDGTAEAALNAAAQLSLPLRVLASRCRDAGGSRNVALSQAQCPWIYMIDADDLHLEGGLRSMLRRAGQQPIADMVVGAYRRRTNGEDRHVKLPAGYTGNGIADASAYLEGHIRSIAVGSAMVSQRLVGDARFPTGLAYDEDTLFWVKLMSRASLALVAHPVMIYDVSAERSDDRFVTRPVRRFLDWRLALRELTDCGIPKAALKAREGLVALKIARVHYARGDLDTAARFLAIAAAAPKTHSDVWRCLRYKFKIAARRRFLNSQVLMQRT